MSDRIVSLFAVAVFAVTPAFAQTVMLGEKVRPGDHFGYDLQLTVDGKMKVERDGKIHPLTLKGEATHQFVERIDRQDTTGGVGKVIRHYATAKSASSVAGDVSKRELSADRRLTVAVRADGTTYHFSPNGPLTREDLELVGEHFDTLALPTLLPNKELKAGDTWAVGNSAAQFACQFEGLIKNDLKGTLTAVKGGSAAFTVEGKVEGIDKGSTTKVGVKASGTFDVAAARIDTLTWEQDDDREQGPVLPAVEVHAKVVITRKPLAAEPKELSAEARVRVPEDKIPAEMMKLRYTHPGGRYTLAFPREWEVISSDTDHAVMRLMEKGEFVAQATLSVWKRVEKGKHSSPDEFKEALTKLTNWQPTEVLSESEPAAAGQWRFKLSVKGKRDGAEVVQTFYLLAGPTGDQVAVTFLSAPDKAAKLTARETELLNGLEFAEKK